eukprot:TRINITY_DN24572_c0_g1_i1.p1 TRINITY_DN24572_c0_g1~~TRINITY_DN24572_c0_g1_i1.p1  ORF type:complete len:261 (+),score=82.16 TRINITY_DN24572_c0_g1_i1:168-950(+)
MTLNPVDEMDMEDDDEFEMEFGAGGEQEGVEQDESCHNLEDPKAVGVDGRGRLWRPNPDHEVDVWGGGLQDSLEQVDQDSESSADESSDDQDEHDLDQQGFTAEVSGTVKRGVTEKLKISNVVLEIRSSLKPAYDKSFGECACAILPPLLDEILVPGNQAKFKASFGVWNKLVQPFVVDQEVQIDLMYELCEYADSRPEAGKNFQLILNAMYDEELVEEEVILRWEKQAEQEGDTKWVQASKAFLTWLKEAESEEESQED